MIDKTDRVLLITHYFVKQILINHIYTLSQCSNWSPNTYQLLYKYLLRFEKTKQYENIHQSILNIM